MENKWALMKYRSLFWSTSHKLDLDHRLVNPFFCSFFNRLLQIGWKNKSQMRLEAPLCENSFVVDRSTPSEGDAAIVTLVKPHQHMLIVGYSISNEGISFSWQQRLDPFLSKLLAILTLGILGIASIFRVILPITNILPLIFFIVGILVNLVIILSYIFRFEKDLEFQNDAAVTFLETLMEFENP